MLVRQHRFAQTLQLACYGGLFVGLSLAPAHGEPIRFSGRTGPAVVQEFDRREPLVPTEAREGSRGVSRTDLPLASLIPPLPMTPTTGLTRRQLEAQEQRRNWIFQSPETLVKPSGESPMEAKSGAARPVEGQFKSSAERFFEGTDTSSSTAERTKAGESPLRSSPARPDNFSAKAKTAREGEANAQTGDRATGFEARNSAGQQRVEGRDFLSATDARSGNVSWVFSDARDRERQRERDASLDAYRRSFSNPWLAPTTGADPLRPVAGAAGAAVGLPTAGLDRRGGPSAFGNAGRAATDFAPRGGVADFDPKNPLNYGTPETVLKANEPPRSTPKPVFLEIPKRKF